MLPSLIGWQVWIATHRLLTSDPAILYYTSYLGLQFATIHPGNLLRVLWVNLDSLIRSIGRLVVFGYPIWSNVAMECVIAAAAICGAVRLIRRRKQFQYAAAAVGMTLLLAGYHYPADERLALPIYPLLLMGFLTEIKHFLKLLRAAWSGRRLRERLLAAVSGAAVAAFLIFAAACYIVGDAVFLPGLYARCASTLAAYRGAYGWLRTHSSPQAAVIRV